MKALIFIVLWVAVFLIVAGVLGLFKSYRIIEKPCRYCRGTGKEKRWEEIKK